MDDRLVEYALCLLDPAERAAVEAHLAGHPDDVAKVLRLQQQLRLLGAARDAAEPPPGLALAAISRTAERVVGAGLFRPDPPVPVTPRRPAAATDPVFPGWGWRPLDVAVAAGIAFVAVGLGLAGLGKLRSEAQVRACQDQLRSLHVALAGYSETHDGRFPQVGTPEIPVAGAFADELARAGQYPPGQAPACPSLAADAPRANYAYTLGYVTPAGTVSGLRSGSGDWTPISADVPAVRLAGLVEPPHARGQNILFVGGAVRFTTTPQVGTNHDYIYSNDAGLVRAGLHLNDASLGRGPDLP